MTNTKQAKPIGEGMQQRATSQNAFILKNFCWTWTWTHHLMQKLLRPIITRRWKLKKTKKNDPATITAMKRMWKEETGAKERSINKFESTIKKFK